MGGETAERDDGRDKGLRTSTLVEYLHRIGRDRQSRADVWISGKDSIDMSGELRSFFLVDGMAHVGVASFDGDFTCLGGQARRVCANFGNELYLSKHRSSSATSSK